MEAGLTQVQAAGKLGRKQQTLASWETGQSQPDANTLFVLCEIYGTTVDELFGFRQTKPLSRRDRRLIEQYHKRVEMQPAVNLLLGLEGEE